MRIFDTLRRIDPVLLGCVFLLIIMSLILLGTDAGVGGRAFFIRQAVFACVGFVVFFTVAHAHYAPMRTLAPIIYGVSLALLAVLFVIHDGGVARWISVGGFFQIQPSEFAKIALVVILARGLSSGGSYPMKLGILFRTIVIAIIPVIMVAMQPDFGMSMILLSIWFGMIFVSGISRRQIMSLVIVGLIGAVAIWTWGLQGYQQERIRIFLNPGADPLGSGYTVIQSVTAFGSGGVWGRGLGHGTQSRLEFLPEHRTDFIFARIGEEFGLVGALGVLVLYSVILYRILFAALRTSDPFGSALVIGVFVTLLSGVVVNAGMNVGLLPVTGVPLPFVSYGGSSMVTMFFLIGLVESVRMYGERWETDEKEDNGLVIAS